MQAEPRQDRESMDVDVVIVGAGPAGLSTAIRLKQLADEKGEELMICVLEKGSEVGAHLLSGAVFEPRALNELIPDWQEKNAPIKTAVTSDKFRFMTASKTHWMPTPPQMHNKGNYIISLSAFGRWLAQQAENMGIEIFPGFAAAEVLYNEDGSVKGVATGDMGIDKKGEKKGTFEPGMELHARQTIFAEGCRGSLTKQVEAHFDLRKDCDPQTYALGVKEIWEIPAEKHQEGLVSHTIGWPLDTKTYGGSFVYHMENNQVIVGFVTGLDYQNPHLSPFGEMQKFKTHPEIAQLLEGGKRIAYGARALSEGGLQSLPKLSFPGGVLVGDCAGFLNVPKIKGNHAAMKSGMLAAEAVFELLTQENPEINEAVTYQTKFEQSWLYKELHMVRNFRPSFHGGLWSGLFWSALETITFGKLPFTRKNHADHDCLKPAKDMPKIDYPKPDNVLTFDRLSSVFIANTNHEEDQPCHLKLADETIPTMHNIAVFAGPEQHYCPAGVYEFINDDHGDQKLQINGQNCIHCKTCDIKDPSQNITWTTPEGTGGPNYSNM